MSQKFFLGFAFIVLVGVGGWWAFSTQSSSDLDNLSASAKLSDAQVQEVIDRISKFMVVPSDEKPSVSVLADVATLEQQQPFYHGAKDGDLLILYAARAIIYDAASNKLVAVGPVQRNDVPAPIASGSKDIEPSGTPAAPEKVVIDVRNGTNIAGLAGSTASTLKKNDWITIGKVGDAKGTFTETTLIDLTNGKKPNAIAALEDMLKVSAITEIPSGESTSTADVLVIVSK